MKFVVMSYTLARQGWQKDGQFDLRGMCELARELKLDGVDMVTHYGLDLGEVRKTIDGYGLKTVCYTFGADLIFPDTAGRQAGVDTIKQGIDAAVALGTSTIMIVTPGKAGVPRDVSRKYIIRGLQEALALARQAGVTMTLENFPGEDSPFVISSDVNEAMREVPGLKLTFDNGNAALGGEDAAVSFERCAANVVHAHFKDWVRVPAGEGRVGLDGRNYSSALIGEGIIDHKSVLQAMSKAGYKGYIDLEYESNTYKADDATRRAAAYLQNIVQQLG